MRLGILGVASIIFLILVPNAVAGQRYAAPAGTGTECTQGEPCKLKDAVGGAKAGEEVIITSGTYEAEGPIFPPAVTNVQIHGDPSGPKPRIIAAFGASVFALTQTGDSLSYVEIEDNANSGVGVTCLGAKLERVSVRIVGIGAIGAFAISECVIRNSLFRVEGVGSIGIRGIGSSTNNSAGFLRNVTAIASGSASTGVSAEYNEPFEGSYTLNLLNSIAQGVEQDLQEHAGAKGPGNIVANHSNFDTSKGEGDAKVIDGGGNQTAPPLFVDAENLNYHEAAGSPTIDAGIAGELGPLDLDGNPRLLGPAPDIGAFETSNPATVTAVAELQSLKLSKASFRAAKSGGAVASAKKKAKGPVGTTVTYSLSLAGNVDFTVEKLTTGRTVGKKCVKQTSANKGKKKCDLAKPLKGGFSDAGAAGQSTFKFTGRLGSSALKPGRYRLDGSAGGVVKRVNFKIIE